MTRTIAPFTPSDLHGFTLNPAQAADLGPARMAESAHTLAKAGSAFTVRDHDGRVLMIAGIARIDDSYGHAWAFMSAHAGPRMRYLTRKVRGYLDARMPSQRRVEMMVRADFAAAIDWAHLLGFEQEGPMWCAAPDGGDMLRFARINPDWRPADLQVAA